MGKLHAGLTQVLVYGSFAADGLGCFPWLQEVAVQVGEVVLCWVSDITEFLARQLWAVGWLRTGNSRSPWHIGAVEGGVRGRVLMSKRWRRCRRLGRRGRDLCRALRLGCPRASKRSAGLGQNLVAASSGKRRGWRFGKVRSLGGRGRLQAGGRPQGSYPPKLRSGLRPIALNHPAAPPSTIGRTARSRDGDRPPSRSGSPSSSELPPATEVPGACRGAFDTNLYPQHSALQFPWSWGESNRLRWPFALFCGL